MVEFRLMLVRVFVSRWEPAVRFYTETLGIEPSFRSDEMGWMQLSTEGAELAIERVDPDEEDAATLIGRFVGVSLAVDDIHAAHRSLLAAGVPFRSPPTRQPWGGILANFGDPDGNVLTLISERP